MANLNVEGVDERVLSVLGYEHVGDQISEEVFQGNLELVTEKPGFVEALEAMRENQDTQAMYQFVISQGRTQIEALIAMSVSSGMLSKADVRSAAKISTARTPKERPWYKDVASVLMAAAHEAIQAAYLENRDAWREQYAEETVADDLEHFLKAVGKSTLGDRVDGYVHPDSGKECATSLFYRIDVNTPSRNGTKKAEKDTNGVTDEEAADAHA